ncbi:hypothetical protein H632_c675p1 [Helicosporidium sp. ATCC 50920]|nr:hypothetical protein H632_c675p1 [Helicosporidium sp. ATCC 50920]|eukprot:KDD75458.1 hypothetical protein H632_c675p1 [Helicosporidium sp. ATCC 50920]
MCIPRLRVDTSVTQLEPSPNPPNVPAQQAGLCASLVESMSPPPPEAEIYGAATLPGSSGRCLANPVYSPAQGGGSGARPAAAQASSSRQSSPSESRVPSGLPPRGVTTRIASKAKSATPLALARRRRASVAVRPQRYGDYFTGDDGELDDCLEAFEAQGAGGKKGKKGESEEEWEPVAEPAAEPPAERDAEDDEDVVKAVHAAAQSLQREMDSVVMQVGEACVGGGWGTGGTFTSWAQKSSTKFSLRF